MWPVVVVVVAPVVDDRAHVAQTGKPMLGQALVTEAAVKALDVSVLNRLARLDEAQFHAVSDSPIQHLAAREFGAIVCSNYFG